jgi:hypothetical protein
VDDGRYLRLDETEVYAKAQAAMHQAWEGISTWHWGGYDLSRIVPPAFTMQRG